MTPPTSTLSREELLALDPEVLLGARLSRRLALPLPEPLRSEGVLALGEQLRDEGVVPDALGLWVSMLHLALEETRQQSGQGEAVARLHTGLRRVAETPRMRAWAEALIARLVDRAAVEAAVELVFLALRVWQVNAALRAAGQS